jgi:pimeloyl-ACP methyl ester carboxylesterase
MWRCARLSAALTPASHRTITIDGNEIFYREAGPLGAPVVLLPHGYPCSSFQFRQFMAALGDRWRLIAPDLPGFGYSATPDPERFSYTFAGYGEFLGRFVELCSSTGTPCICTTTVPSMASGWR